MDGDTLQDVVLNVVAVIYTVLGLFAISLPRFIYQVILRWFANLKGVKEIAIVSAIIVPLVLLGGGDFKTGYYTAVPFVGGLLLAEALLSLWFTKDESTESTNSG